MEAFSLLKYWRNNGAGNGGGPDGSAATNLRTSSNSTTTIVTAVSSLASETDEDEGNDDDDGPFFDLEFAVPDEEQEALQHSKPGETDDDDEDADSDESDVEDENELKFTLSSGSSAECTDPNVSVSPSDELFFKGRLVPMEHSTTDLNGLENNSKLHFPVSLVKSATKIRVMMLKLKKSKSNVSENTESKTLKKDKVEKSEPEKSNVSENTESKSLKKDKVEKSEPEKEGKEHSKLFTVKFKANELPIVSSLFVRDNSSKNLTSSKTQKENAEESAANSDDKKFSKESVQRYLSGTVRNIQKVKPLYIRVSKRYGEKLRFSGQLSTSGAAKDVSTAPPCTAENKNTPSEKNEKESTAEAKDAAAGSNVKTAQRQCSLPAGLRVVYKHLGKSRSASSAAVAAAPPRAVSSKRRDDSLLQQQDGIQSAILHCKRSFKASRDMECSIVEGSASSGDKETCR